MAPQHPVVKLTKTKVTKFNIGNPGSSTNDDYDADDSYNSPEMEQRFSVLKNKLAETTTNLAILRSWVGDTIETVKSKKPKNTKDMIRDLKELIVKLDEYAETNRIINQRGEECITLMKGVEEESCLCALTSPSCEAIKTQLDNVMSQIQSIDETIDKTQDKGKAKSLAQEAKKEISDVVKACSDETCLKKLPPLKSSASMSKGNASKSIQNKNGTTEAGAQYEVLGSLKRPKLTQTYDTPKWDQGTICQCK